MKKIISEILTPCNGSVYVQIQTAIIVKIAPCSCIVITVDRKAELRSGIHEGAVSFVHIESIRSVIGKKYIYVTVVVKNL